MWHGDSFRDEISCAGVCACVLVCADVGPRLQASKTGMIMELNHPGWQDSVENAASVAVDAAIRAETYNGGDALMMVERAAVEGATKAAKEMEIKAEQDGSQGPSEQAVAQRVENSAGGCFFWGGGGCFCVLHGGWAAGGCLGCFRGIPWMLTSPCGGWCDSSEEGYGGWATRMRISIYPRDRAQTRFLTCRDTAVSSSCHHGGE